MTTDMPDNCDKHLLVPEEIGDVVRETVEIDPPETFGALPPQKWVKDDFLASRFQFDAEAVAQAGNLCLVLSHGVRNILARSGQESRLAIH